MLDEDDILYAGHPNDGGRGGTWDGRAGAAEPIK